MPIATVAMVYQRPIRDFVNEIARVFRKWMKGNAVDDDCSVLFYQAQ
jgi:hypothetical protein